MSEPTDEMLAAFRDAWMHSMQSDPRTGDPERIADRAGLTAVLAIVERDQAQAEIDPAALEAARKAVEDVLIEHRDSRIFVIGGNGFVCREKDGTDSSVMRLSTAMGLQIGIKAYLAAALPTP